MKARLATIDLDWLEGEIEQLNTTIQELIKKKIESHGESKYREIENRLDLLSHELLVLHNLRKKCVPIDEQKDPELPNYCVVKNKEYCFLSGKCKGCLEEPIANPHFETKDNAINSGFVGIGKGSPTQSLVLSEEGRKKSTWTKGTIEDNIPNDFLSKTCINDWESNAYCPNENKCELCKIK